MKSLEKAIELMEDAAKSATYENADFSRLDDGFKPITLNTREEIDAFVKARTDLHRRTWIVPPINHALSILKANAELIKAMDDLAHELEFSPLIRAVSRMKDASEKLNISN